MGVLAEFVAIFNLPQMAKFKKPSVGNSSNGREIGQADFPEFFQL